MTVLYVFLGIVIFLFLILCIPIRVYVEFREEFVLKIGYFFLNFTLFPARQDKPKKEKKKKEDSDKPEESVIKKFRKILKRTGFGGFLSALQDFAVILKDSLCNIVRRIKIRDFDLYMSLGGADDAAQAAIRYGQISAGVYSVCGLLFSLKSCKKKGITLDLNYNSFENKVIFMTRVSVLPLFLLIEAIRVFFGGISFLKKLTSSPLKKETEK